MLKLVVWNLNTSISIYWGQLTSSFSNTLTSLDLSGCGEFQDFEFLRKFRSLRSLILYNVLISGKVDDEDEDDEEQDSRRRSRGTMTKKKRRSNKTEGLRGMIVGEDRMLDVSSSDDEYFDEDDKMRMEQDEEMRIRQFVVFLKDEDEGVRGGNSSEEGIDVGSAEYQQQRRKLEKLVNKLVAPICDLKELR